MPCLSSFLPTPRPGVPFSTTKKLGPAGVLARIVYRSATPPLVMNCLAAVQAVAGDPAVGVEDRVGRRLERGDVAARLRLGHAVGDDQALGRDARQPALLLLRRAAHQDRIGAQADRQERGGHAQIPGRHLLAHAADVARAAAEAAVSPPAGRSGASPRPATTASGSARWGTCPVHPSRGCGGPSVRGRRPGGASAEPSSTSRAKVRREPSWTGSTFRAARRPRSDWVSSRAKAPVREYAAAVHGSRAGPGRPERRRRQP